MPEPIRRSSQRVVITAIPKVGLARAISGAVTIVLSVLLAAILFVLAVVPLLLGVFQVRVGLAAVRREQRSGRQLLAAALGGVVGVPPPRLDVQP